MTRTTTTNHAAFFAVLTISLCLCLGCNPIASDEAKKKNNTPKTEGNQITSTEKSAEPAEPSATTPAKSPPDTKNPAPKRTESSSRDTSSSSPVLISGNLQSVDWQSLIGKEVTVPGKLVVVDTYDLIRRGQVKVARDRLYIPTSTIDPNDSDPNGNSFEGGGNVAQVAKARKFNESATITLDDGPADQNIFPPSLFQNLGKTYPTVRIGSVINGVSGKLVKAGRNILLVPNRPLDWQPAERPAKPDVGDADVTVASFNVLNYFTTIDDGRNNARGADSEAELNRQEAKLVAAIMALDADVIGLMELENNLNAEQRLVGALNEKIGNEVFQGSGLPDGFRAAPGGQNAIRVGIIYRRDRVEPVSDVAMIKDNAFANARTPILQSFKSAEDGKPFTLIVNHFKSKGGSDKADAANKDKGDGQGGFNAVRRAQALAICKFIDEQQSGNAIPRVLVIGDLNAYDQEDPVDAMRAKGLVDLREKYNPKTSDGNQTHRHYSFIYYGQSGSLDHAMATKTLADDITGVGTWHINSDEPRFLDYNQEFNPKPLYSPDPFRSSDHDPILIGIKN